MQSTIGAPLRTLNSLIKSMDTEAMHLWDVLRRSTGTLVSIVGVRGAKFKRWAHIEVFLSKKFDTRDVL